MLAPYLLGGSAELRLIGTAFVLFGLIHEGLADPLAPAPGVVGTP